MLVCRAHSDLRVLGAAFGGTVTFYVRGLPCEVCAIDLLSEVYDLQADDFAEMGVEVLS